MERKKKVLLIENDVLPQMKIMSHFLQELSVAAKLNERNVEVSLIGVSQLPEEEEEKEFDIALIEPSMAVWKKRIVEKFAAFVVVDLVDLPAYGFRDSKLVVQQIIDILENGRRPKNKSGKKEFKGKRDLAAVFVRPDE